MAGPGIHPVAHGGAKGFTDQAGALQPETHIGNGQPHQGKVGPLMKAPMKQRITHGHTGRLRAFRFSGTKRRRNKVAHGLGHRPEHQPHPHTGGKDHAQPGQVGELRRLAVGPQAYPAVVTAGNRYAEHQETRGGKQIKPAKVQGGELQGLVGIEGQLVRHQPAGHHKDRQQNK